MALVTLSIDEPLQTPTKKALHHFSQMSGWVGHVMAAYGSLNHAPQRREFVVCGQAGCGWGERRKAAITRVAVLMAAVADIVAVYLVLQ